jgi:hypothetical protein
MFGSGVHDCAWSRGDLPAQAVGQQPDQHHRQRDLCRTDGAYSTVRRGAVDFGGLCCLLLLCGCEAMHKLELLLYVLLSLFLVKGLQRGARGFSSLSSTQRKKFEKRQRGRSTTMLDFHNTTMRCVCLRCG